MAITKARMTEEEFMRLPDDGRKYELVDGEAKEVPAGHRHDAIGANVIILLGPHARGRGILASSQAGFRMACGNIRSPDVSFTLKERLLDGEPSEGFEGLSPDLCVEIISPSEDKEDMRRKVREYFGSGAQQVWHLFPQAHQLLIYHSPTQSALYEAEDEIDGGELLPGFRCRVAELFEIG